MDVEYKIKEPHYTIKVPKLTCVNLFKAIKNLYDPIQV